MTILLSATLSPIASSLGWALFYSLCQGLLVYISLTVILKIAKEASARVKHNLACMSLATVFAAFVYTWADQWQKLQAYTIYITNNAATGEAHSYSVNALPSEPASHSLWQQFIHNMEHALPSLVAIYVAGLAFMIARLFISIYKVRQVKTKNLELINEATEYLIENAVQRFAITKNVKAFISSRVSAPAMIGFLKPVVLLPASVMTALTTDQLESIILHELAHIKRNDYLLNLIQTVIETILFFNPFVWLISSFIRKEREHCCDDIVLEATESPMLYARTLALLEHERITKQNLLLSVADDKQKLFHRIKRIMEMKKTNTNQQGTMVAVFIAAAIAICTISFAPSFAQKTKTTTNSPVHQKDTTITKTTTIIIDDNGKKHTYTQSSNAPVIIKDMQDDDDKNGEDINVKVIVDSAMASINWNEINAEVKNVQKEVDNIDWDQINKDIEQATQDLSNVHVEEIKKEIDEAMKSCSPEMKRKIHNEVEASLQRSRQEIAQARIEMRNAKKAQAYAYSYSNGSHHSSYSNSDNYNQMLDKMERDGLISRSEGFKIKVADGSLYINGEHQPENIYNKYSDYFNASHITIKGKANSLDIRVTN